MNDLFKHENLIAAIRDVTPVSTFLRDTYFPCNPSTDIFKHEDVLVEYKDGNKKLAPFVAPRHKNVPVLRDGYTAQRYTPAFVAPRRTLTVDDLAVKGFGEELYNDLDPADRQQMLLRDDLKDLEDRIMRREEAMAAEVMTSNACVIKSMADDASETKNDSVFFYDVSNGNDAAFSVTTKWGESNAAILSDLSQMVQKLTRKGLPVRDLICSPDVADAIVNNDEVQKLLDNRRIMIGGIEPRDLGAGAAVVATLNIRGRNIDVITYDETYTNDAGEDVPFIPAGTCVLTAPATGNYAPGKTLYGGVQYIPGDSDDFVTAAAEFMPKYISNAENDTRSLTVYSRPLLIPYHKNAFVSAKVL